MEQVHKSKINKQKLITKTELCFHFSLMDEINVEWLMLVSFLFILRWGERQNYYKDHFSSLCDTEIRNTHQYDLFQLLSHLITAHKKDRKLYYVIVNNNNKNI